MCAVLLLVPLPSVIRNSSLTSNDPYVNSCFYFQSVSLSGEGSTIHLRNVDPDGLKDSKDYSISNTRSQSKSSFLDFRSNTSLGSINSDPPLLSRRAKSAHHFRASDQALSEGATPYSDGTNTPLSLNYGHNTFEEDYRGRADADQRSKMTGSEDSQKAKQLNAGDRIVINLARKRGSFIYNTKHTIPA